MDLELKMHLSLVLYLTVFHAPQGKFLWILTRLDEYYFGKGLVYSRLKDEKRSHFAEKEEQMGADLIAERYYVSKGRMSRMLHLRITSAASLEDGELALQRWRTRVGEHIA